MADAASDEFDPDVGPPEVWEDWMRVPWRLKALDVLRRTGNVSAACREVGISRQQFYRTREEVPGFADAVAGAAQEAADLLEQVAWGRATTGQKLTETREVVDASGNLVSRETKEITKTSDTLLIFLLKGLRPEKYRENVSVIHTGKDGKPIEIKVERERSPERLAELLEIAHDLGWNPSGVNALPPQELPPGEDLAQE